MATKSTTAKSASKTAKKAAPKKSTAKKTARKATAKAPVIESTTPFEDVATKAQERYFAALEQGQNVALEGFETVVETVNRISNRVADEVGDRIELQSIPGLSALPTTLPKLNIPSDMPANLVDGYFEFADKALANQRKFAEKALAIATKS